jgi:hypothetical protein
LDRILEKWVEWNGENKILQLAETPPPYRTGHAAKPKPGLQHYKQGK